MVCSLPLLLEWRVKSWSKQNNVTLSYMNLGFDGELDFKNSPFF